jgi:hypothetical protein
MDAQQVSKHRHALRLAPKLSSSSDRSMFRTCPHPRRSAFSGLLLACLALTRAPGAHAGPLEIEDAEVQAIGECELESYAGRAIERGQARADAVATQFGCGLLPATYLGLAYARELSDHDAPQTLVLAGKTALRPAGDDGSPGYAICWGTVGKKILGTAFRYDGWYATLARSATLPSGWTVHANLGATAEHHGRTLTGRWSLAAERPLGTRGRFGLATFADSREPAPWLQAGLSMALPLEGASANASWGTQLATAHRRLATVGIVFDL